MGKKPVEEKQVEDQHDEDTDEVLEVVQIAEDNTFINGHKLKKGDYVELAEDIVAQHRGRGVPLLSVHVDTVAGLTDDDFVDVSEPYVAQDEGDGS